MRYIARCVPPGTVARFVQQAAARGLTLRDYVGRRVVVLAERRTNPEKTFVGRL